MKQILLALIFTLQINFVVGQQAVFMEHPVDTIIISSSSGAYNFKMGRSVGRSNSFVISYQKNKNEYVATDFISKKKLEHLKTGSRKVIPTISINGLLTSLSSRYETPTFNTLDLNMQEFRSFSSEKHVRKIAKAYKEQWHFKMAYSTKEENNAVFARLPAHCRYCCRARKCANQPTVAGR